VKSWSKSVSASPRQPRKTARSTERIDRTLVLDRVSHLMHARTCLRM
jgi:hypothetical protein